MVLECEVIVEVVAVDVTEGLLVDWLLSPVIIVSFAGLLQLFGFRDPVKAKLASSNRFVSVERLSVAKRLSLWQISGSWCSDKARKTVVFSRRFQAFGGVVCERELLRRAMAA